MTVTDSDTATSTPHTETAPAAGGSTRAARGCAREGNDRNRHRRADTHSDDRAAGTGRLLDLLTPPEPWQHRPASLAAMWRYARRGGWTGPTGPARAFGVWWYRLVALPVTVLCHYGAWIIARPARTATVAVLWAVAMQVPALRAIAEALLPWQVWPGGSR